MDELGVADEAAVLWKLLCSLRNEPSTLSKPNVKHQLTLAFLIERSKASLSVRSRHSDNSFL